MSSIPYDLGLMIFERVQPRDLKEVSRVNHEWRDTISENKHRMRLCPCDRITIDYAEPMEIYVYKYTGLLISNSLLPGRCLPRSKIPSLYDILKYQTFTLEIEHYDDWIPGGRSKSIGTEDLSKLLSFLEALPDWWFKKLIEVRLQVCGSFPSATLCSRFPHLKQMIISIDDETCWNITLSRVNELIRGAPRVDLFAFEMEIGDRKIRFSDDLLETIMRKSWIYPTSTPPFSGFWPTFSLRQVIRFLELTSFIPKLESYDWKLDVSVEGRLEDWKEWLRRNTIQLPIPDGVTYPDNRHHFLFRGHEFHIFIYFLTA